MNRVIYIFIVSSLLLITSCNLTNQDSYREMVFVESYLVSGRVLPAVRLSKTLPIEEEYNFEDAVVLNANVRIHLLGENHQPVAEFSYFMSEPGVYHSNNPRHRIQPNRTYRLVVDNLPNRGTIQAETLIPGSVQITSEAPELLVYQQGQLELSMLPESNPGRDNVFIFTTISQVRDTASMTPFYRSIVDDENRTAFSLSKNSSDLLHQDNFDLNFDGSITFRFPWLGIVYYGVNDIVVNSIDNNIKDFVRSHNVQLGGSTLSPGEIPNVIYNIDGGIGIFGGLSADTLQIFVQRPEEF